ncbi:MAG: ATP-binding cassette domain-containing protein [Clostridia bacterium]|nr:ATP-binding cassette domain-containing protein [Clostridia bacterium]
MPLQVDIEKTLGDFHLKVAFRAETGVLALLGASGCGKSMTLKCIAGVEKPDRGRIVLDDRVLFDSDRGICLPPQKRQIGFLFQQYALFPNMSVRQNIICGVRERKGKREAADAMIQRMHLEGLEDKKPGQLSGGQQQRTALARILVSQPGALLLDEPFSAMDSHLRFQLEREVRHTIRLFQKPVILVSHSRDEVYRLANVIAVMGSGCIETIGGKHEVFADPATRTGAVLTGCKNVSPVRRTGGQTFMAADWGIPLTLPGAPPDTAYVGIRMHDIRPAREGETLNVFRCRVEEEIENPFSFTVMLRPENTAAPLPLGWEMEKPAWERLRAEWVTVCLPQEGLLKLKGESTC